LVVAGAVEVMVHLYQPFPTDVIVEIVNTQNMTLELTVFEKDIYTKMDLSYKITTFLSSYWQWIITTFLLPLLVYIWNKKRKSKEN